MQKKGQPLSLTKQLKAKMLPTESWKPFQEDLKPQLILSPDPDKFQWLIYEKDKKKREDEAAAANNSKDQHQWKGREGRGGGSEA